MKLSETVASTGAIDILQAAIEALPGGTVAITNALAAYQTAPAPLV